MRLSDTPFVVLTDNADRLAPGRRNVLAYTCLSGFITNIVTGTYFVGLMLEMGAGEAYISAVTVAITVCGFLQFFSPLLLERMQRRKHFLLVMRTVYHLLQVVLMGVIPLLPLPRNTVLGLFFGAVILANLVNALTLSGISVWHMQSIPAGKHSDFFTLSNVGSQVINAVTGFSASRIVDLFRDGNVTATGLSPSMLAFLLLRAASLAAAICEIVCLTAIREYPYAEADSAKQGVPRLSTLLVPLTNRPFMKTILIYIVYFFNSALIGKYFEVYLLEIVGMSYTFKSLSGVVSLPIVLLLSPVWSTLLRKFSWTRVMPFALIGTAVGYFFNTLITPDTQYFHILCCVFYSSFHAAVAIIFAYLPYINMPKDNRTAYISFFTISGTAAGLLGNLCGMLFMSISCGWEYNLFGLRITNYQTLNLIQTVLFLLLATYSAAAVGKKEKHETGK